jgi:hypothetical protein
MKTENAPAELIDRYLFAVGEELPRDSRADVTRELRTLIEDKLEDRAQTLQKPIDAALVSYVLQEIGEPRSVARRYDPKPEYLIGPRFYPAFIKIVKIGLAGLAALILLSTLLGHSSSPAGAAGILAAETLWSMAKIYFQVAIALFGEAVIVLAILERTSLGQKVTSKPWDPRDLPELPEGEQDRLSVAGLAVEICLIVFFACILNFAPDWIGVLMVNTSGHPLFVKLTEFGLYLPVLALDILWAWALVLKFAVIAQRRWTKLTRWLEIGQGIFAAAVVFAIATHSSIHAPASCPQIEPALPVFKLVLTIAPFAVLIQPLIRVVHLVRGNPELARAQR